MERVAHGGRETPVRCVGSDADGIDDGPVALYVHGSGGTHQVWAHQYGPERPVGRAAALDLAGHDEAEDIDVGADVDAEADVDADEDAEADVDADEDADVDVVADGVSDAEAEADADGVRDAEGVVMDAYVDDVAAVADAIGADVLVGNSLGGAVVLRALLDDRVDPEAVVLAGTGAKLAVAEDLRRLLAEDFERTIEVLHGEDMLFHDADDELRRRSVETMRAVGQRVTRGDFLACHRFDVRDRLDEIDVPALAVVGEHDALTPVAHHEYLAEEIPDGELAVVDDAAHLAMLERPTTFNETVAEFREDVLSGASTS